MQHGMGGDSSVWTETFNGATHEDKIPMAFQFAEAGFDVWIPNNSGTKYGWEHEVYTVDDKEFWDLDWTVNALYDTPAIVKEI